jgi:translation initiation factor 2-alpha kinase 4
MERVVVLEQLRQHELFPEAFEREQKYSSARKIIRWLLQRQPDDRPSALELLNSKLLPSDAIQDNYVDKIVTALAAPESAAYARIMDALFSQDKQRGM